MALFNLELDPKNFDQMIQDRNSRTVTHFFTRAAMCATVNSLSIPWSLSSLVFDQKAKTDCPKRVLFDGFLYAYFCNISVFYKLLSASFVKQGMNVADYVNFAFLNGNPNTKMRRNKTHAMKRGVYGKFMPSMKTIVPLEARKSVENK